jgi:uncharacterized protein involved in exopolysaccharide biosynthesis
MNAVVHNAVSKRELILFLCKYRKRLLTAFFVPLLLCLVISLFVTPHYKAYSVLIVRLGSEYIYQPEIGNAVSNPAPAIPFNQEQIFKSEVAILGSEDLHAQVINAIGIDTLFPNLIAASESQQLAEAVEQFNKHFNIFLEKESAVIDISFEHKDRALAIKALDTLLSLYMDKRKQLYLEPRAKLAEAEAQSRHEQALKAGLATEDYKRKHNIYSLETQRLQLLAQRNEVQKQSVNISNAGLESKLANFTRQLDQLDKEEREFNALEAEAQIAEDSYRLYSHKLDEAKAYENIQHSRADSVRVIQPPTAPSRPQHLRLLIILGGFFLALLSVLTTAAATEFLRNGFLTPEQIERHLELPVLSVMPFYK